MSYVQIRQNGRVLTRSMEIDPSGKIRGYPAYRAEWTDRKTSVLSILFRDSTGIYLTSDKTYRLALIYGSMYFSSDLLIKDYIPDNIQEIRWYDTWANQKNTTPEYTGLVVPPLDPKETLDLLVKLNVPISLFRDVPNNQGRNIPWADQGAWIGSTTATQFLKGDRPELARVLFSWWPSSEVYSSAFFLRDIKGSWALSPVLPGVPDFQSLRIGERHAGNTGKYVGDWGDSNANRWNFSNEFIMTFDINHIGGYTYQLWKGDRRLNQAGHWSRISPKIDVYNGTEFYNGNDIGVMNIDFVVMPNTDANFILDDITVFRLGPFVRAMHSMKDDFSFSSINPDNIKPNMPKGGEICNTSTGWNGTMLNCTTQKVAYDNVLGPIECTSLDDFTNDIHCQQWALNNKSPIIEDMMKNLCINTSYDNPEVCNCFLPNSVYEDRIVTAHNQATLNAVRATNILQCSSGLCNQDGTFSSNLFYYGNKKCDYCIISGDINLIAQGNIDNNTIVQIQQCSSTDSSYTWVDLIDYLKFQGAYVIGSTPTTPVFYDVIISSNDLYIFLNISTDTGRIAISNSSSLQYIPPITITPAILSIFPFLHGIDPTSYMIISKDIWKSDISGYSSDIKMFMLVVRTLILHKTE